MGLKEFKKFSFIDNKEKVCQAIKKKKGRFFFIMLNKG